MEAVLCLMRDRDPEARYADICMLIADWDSRPTYFAEHLAPLNPLIDIGRCEPNLLDQLATLLGFKSDAEETGPTAAAKSDRNRYQRGYMRARRARLAKALAVETAGRPELPPEAKVELQAQIMELWRQKREAFLASRSAMTFKERNRATSEFWATVDNCLESGSLYNGYEPDTVSTGLAIHVKVACVPPTANIFLSKIVEAADVAIWELAEELQMNPDVLKGRLSGATLADKGAVGDLVRKIKAATEAGDLPVPKYVGFKQRRILLRRLLGA